MPTSLLFRVISIFIFTFFSVTAQESRGTVAGQVTDQQNSSIIGAKVTLRNVETGIDTVLNTNEHGAFAAPLLIPGSYQITAEHQGFKKYARRGITVSVNDNLRIDVKLELGDVAQTIDVTDSAPLIEATNGTLGILISSKELTEMPIAHGNPYALIALAPGTTFEGDPKLNRPYEPTHIVDYSMSGSTSGTTDITLDGVSNTSKGANGRVAAGYVPPVDAIGEMRVETSSFDARTGQSSGGLVNISLRSGTNKLHGSGTYTKMKPQWMANDFFANKAGIGRGDFNYDRWSGSLSGPIYVPKLYDGHNKTFFMWAYEALSDSRPRGGTTLTVPTADMRKGDFSELTKIGGNYQIFNPFTRRRVDNGTTRYQQDPFPDNIIPPSLINPVANKVQTYFPLPINAGTTVDHRNNFPRPTSPELADYFTHTVRVDHNISASNRIFIRGNMYERDTRRNDYFETQATGLREAYSPQGASFDDVIAISPSLVLNLRYGYTRFTRRTSPLHGRNFDLTNLGFPKAFASLINPDQIEFPVFNINGYFTTNNAGEARFMDTHSAVAAFNKLRGNHNIDFGAEARAYRQSRYNGNSSRSGNFVFDTTWTRGPLDNGTASPIGQGFAAFLLGLPAASSLIARNGDMAEQSTLWAGYVQDNWRVKRNLTLTLGIRYEIEGPLTERYNRSVRDFAFNTGLPIEKDAQAAYAASYAANPTKELLPDQFKVRGGLLFAGVDGQPRELWTRDSNNFMPRFGLAYTFRKTTVFRGGYGMYFSGLGLRRADVLQNGYDRNTSLVPSRDTGLSFVGTLSNPFPDGILESVGNRGGLMTDVGNSVNYFLPTPKASYNQRWQASLQRQLGRTMVVEAAYVGNRGTKLEVARDLNVVGNDLLSRSPFFDLERVNYLGANIANPFVRLPGVNGTLGTNNTIARETLLKPFPQFTAVNTSNYQGYSWYHSLQVRATRRFSNGFGLNGSYTWAKNMEAVGYLNPGDDAPYETLGGSDRRHRLTLSTMYELPFGKRGKFWRSAPRLVNGVIGGWQLSTIWIYQSGVPLGWGDVVFQGNPDDIRTGPQTPNQWFNINAGFTRNTATRPAAYHYRSWPFRFANIRGPSMNNVDLSINKRWKLNERGAEVQLRGEGLNAFNHVLFAGPTTDQFSTAFGQITGAANYPRQIQAVLRINF